MRTDIINYNVNCILYDTCVYIYCHYRFLFKIMNMPSSSSSTPSPNPTSTTNGSNSGTVQTGNSGQISTSSNALSGQQQPSSSSNSAHDAPVSPERIACWITELLSSNTRENALMELSRKREKVVDLAVLLWHSFGSVAVLLHEVM